MIVKLLTEHHLAFLSLKGGCTGSSESTLVKMSNCWKSRAWAHIIVLLITQKINSKACMCSYPVGLYSAPVVILPLLLYLLPSFAYVNC